MNKLLTICVLVFFASLGLAEEEKETVDPAETLDALSSVNPLDSGFMQYDMSDPSGKARPMGYGYGFFEALDSQAPIVDAPALDSWRHHARAPTNVFLMDETKEYSLGRDGYTSNIFLDQAAPTKGRVGEMTNYFLMSDDFQSEKNAFLNVPNEMTTSTFFDEYERISNRWWIKR